jgi:hypothetical protein
MEVSDWQLAAISNWQLAQLAKASPVLGIGTWHFYEVKETADPIAGQTGPSGQRRDSRLLALLVRSRSG